MSHWKQNRDCSGWTCKNCGYLATTITALRVHGREGCVIKGARQTTLWDQVERPREPVEPPPPGLFPQEPR